MNISGLADEFEVLKSSLKGGQISLVYFRGFYFLDNVQIDKGIEVLKSPDVVGAGGAGKISGVGFDSVKQGSCQPG